MVTGENRKEKTEALKKVPTDGHQELGTITGFIHDVQKHLRFSTPSVQGFHKVYRR